MDNLCKIFANDLKFQKYKKDNINRANLQKDFNLRAESSEDLPKAKCKCSFQNKVITASIRKPPEQELQIKWVSYLRKHYIGDFMRTRMILDSLTSKNNPPNQQFSTAIALNRLRRILCVIEQHQNLYSMLKGENLKTRLMIPRRDDVCIMVANDLEFQKLMNDTTDMVNVVKKILRKHINIEEILTTNSSDTETACTTDSDGYDTDDAHADKKIKLSK